MRSVMLLAVLSALVWSTSSAEESKVKALEANSHARYARSSPLRWGKRSSSSGNNILRWGKRSVDDQEQLAAIVEDETLGHERALREAPLRWGKRYGEDSSLGEESHRRVMRASPLRWGKRSTDEDKRAPLRWGKRAPLRWGKRSPVRFGKRAPLRFGKRGPTRFGKREDMSEEELLQMAEDYPLIDYLIHEDDDDLE